MQNLEFIAKYVWPVRRLLVRSLARRCSVCIVSERRNPLDASGVCDPCDQYRRNNCTRVTPIPCDGPKLNLVLQDAYKKGKTYDAMVMLSGGKDSAYVLHKIRVSHPKLRVLCVLVDNGFMAEVAIENAVRVAGRTCSDLVILNHASQLFASRLRQAFLDLPGRGSYKLVDHADGATVFEVARSWTEGAEIPLIIGGLSWVQLMDIVGVSGFEIPRTSGPREIHPIAALRPHEQEIRNYVRDHQLIKKGNDSPLVTNSELILPMCVADFINIGYCSFEPEFGQLVREGKACRKLWRNIFEMLEWGTRNGSLIKAADKTLSKLGLSIGQVTK